MNDHKSAREALGSYLLGALDPAERDRVATHLKGCVVCRDEFASYAALPGLMSRLSREEIVADQLDPPAALLPRTLAAVEAERAASRGRVRRWRGAALGVAGLAAAASVAAVLVLPGAGRSVPGAPPVSGRPLVATAGAAGGGAVSLERRPWGTQVRLSLHDLPRQGTFTAWALDAHGTRTPAATWRATPDGHAEVTGAVALDPADLSRLQISSSDGTPLLSI